MKSITKPGKSGIYHQKQKKNSITGFQKRQPGLSPPIFGFQWLQRRTLFLYHRLAHPIWQRLNAGRPGWNTAFHKATCPKITQKTILYSYAWIFFNNHAIFCPKAFIVRMPSSSFSTSPFCNPKPMFQYIDPGIIISPSK